MPNPERVRKLYNALSADYDLGTLQEFSDGLKDPSNRQKAHAAVSKKYDVGDFDTFTRDLGYGGAGNLLRGASRSVERLREKYGGGTPDVNERAIYVPRRQGQSDRQYQQEVARGQQAVERRNKEVLKADYRKRREEIENAGTDGSAPGSSIGALLTGEDKGRPVEFTDAEGNKQTVYGESSVYYPDEKGNARWLTRYGNVYTDKAKADAENDRFTEEDKQEYIQKWAQHEAEYNVWKKNEEEWNKNAGFGNKKPWQIAAGPSTNFLSSDIPNHLRGNLMKGSMRLNPKTGKMEQTWWTSDKRMFYNQTEAEMHQHDLDTVKMLEWEETSGEEGRQHKLNRLMKETDAQLEAMKKEKEASDRAFGGLLARQQLVPGGAPPSNDPRDVAVMEERSLILAKKRLLEKQKHILYESQNKETRGFWRNVWGTLTNPSTWSFGIIPLEDAMTLSKLNSKIENRTPLAPEEEDLLNTLITTNDVEQQYGGDMGANARWGVIAGEAIPFVVEFTATGGFSGIAEKAGSTGARLLAKATLTDLSKKGFRSWAVKATGTVTGDLLAANLMANTVGAPKTIADAMNRYRGNDIIQDENGNYHFGHYEDDGNGGYQFVDGGETLFRSIYEAETSQTLEYYTEMLGNHLDGPLGWIGAKIMKGTRMDKVGRYLLQKLSLGEISHDLSRITYNGYGRAVNALKKGGIQGYPSEVIEEEANILLNSLLVGDNKFSDLIDGKTQADIWGGMLFSIGFMSGIPTAAGSAYTAQRYHSAKHKMEKAGRIASFRLTQDKWEPLQERIDETDNDNFGYLIMDIANDESLSEQEKKAVFDYMEALLKFRGFNLSTVVRGKGENDDEEESEEEAERREDESATDATYTEGYNAEEPEQMQVIRIAMEEKRKQIEEIANEQLLKMLDEAPIKALSFIRNQDSWTDEEKQLAFDYVNAKTAYDGMIQRVKDDMDTEADSITTQIQVRVHSEDKGGDGMIHPLTLVDGTEVDLIDGRLVLDDEGNVDYGETQGALIVRDPNTGKTDMIYADEIASVESPIDPREIIEPAVAASNEQIAAERGNIIDGVLAFQPGDKYTVMDDNGQVHEVTVQSDNGDGTVETTVDGQAIPMVKEQLQQWADNMARSRVKQGGGTAMPSQTTEEGGTQDGRQTVEAAGQTVEAAQEPVPQEPATPLMVPMPMIGRGENAEPDFLSTTPERGRRYLYGEESGLSRDEANGIVDANIDDAQKRIEKLRKKVPEPGVSVAKFIQEKAKWKQQVDDEQKRLDYWNEVKRQRVAEDSRAAQERAAKDEAMRQAAIEAEQKRRAEELAKYEEQKRLGHNVVHPDVKRKWDEAEKVEGNRDEIVLPNGERMKGRYMLVESGTAMPSHNATREFVKNDGFPQDKNGQTVNDRDYERDKAAQAITRQMGANYDSRALQSVPVVSQDGVVLSGNGRTMAGELAARDNTDGAYIDYLKDYGQRFGFSAEQVGAMKHPRVVFVPDAEMPYTTETFSKFNEQEMKGQSKTEQAVKLGKLVDDATFGRVLRMINRFDTLGDFYADNNATREAIRELQRCGALNEMQHTEMFDGEKLSESGKEMLENMLIGKAFETNPDAVRMLTEKKSMRQRVVNALAEIVNNVSLGEDYTLQEELAQAINLAYRALNNDYKIGEQVSSYARQTNLFAEDEGETVADFRNKTVMLLADVLNDKRVNRLKQVLALYNNRAQDAANGQMDIFSGGVKSKEEIINEVNELLGNATKEEQQEHLDAAAAERKRRANEEQGSEPAGQQGGEQQGGQSGEDKGTEQTAAAGRGSEGDGVGQQEYDRTPVARDKVSDAIRNLMEHARTVKNRIMRIVLSNVTDRQIEEYRRKGITGITPDFVHSMESSALTHESNRHDGDNRTQIPLTEDEMANVVDVIENFDSVEKGGRTSTGLDTILYKKDMGDGTIVYVEEIRTGRKTLAFKTAYKKRKQAGSSGELLQNSHPQTSSTTPDNPSNVSAGKGSEKSATVQGKPGKSAENQSPNEMQAALAAAEAETNTNPTDAQKEAGNYRKGHVRIDGFDVTIENPKGSVRRGRDASGKEWSVTMHNTYGYIRGTEGVDGDHIDVFLSDGLDGWNGMVYVVDQVNEDGTFDEYKVMYGFNTMDEAVSAYLSNYSPGWRGLGSITGVDKEEFKKWIASSHRKTKPFSEYKSVKADEGQGLQGEDRGDASTMMRQSGTQGVTREEKELRDGINDWLRGTGFTVETSEEVGQRVLDEARREDVREMGSRVERRKRQLASEIEGLDLSDSQQIVADVFTGRKNNAVLNVTASNGEQRRVTMRQGNEQGAGTKHSLYRHYGTTEGYITAEDILTIPDVLSNGERTEKRRGKTRLYEYRLTADDGTRKTVLTEVDNHGHENFADFYTNRKASTAARKTHSEEAQTDTGNALSGAKLQKIGGSGKFSPVFYSNALHAVEGIKQKKATAEQWLAMIQKAGGLKAGEDKWLGLSDWLNERKGKSLTKDEVLGFIRENQVEGQPMFFRTKDGEVYGYTMDGKIYIDPRVATAETPVHEYVHLWAESLMKANPEAWSRLREQILGQDDVLAYVKRLYPELEGDELVEEVFAHFAGRRGAERLRQERDRMMQEADGVFAKSKVAVLFDKIVRALKNFWQMSRDLFAGSVKGLERLSAEDFADMALSDLAHRVKPAAEDGGGMRYSKSDEIAKKYPNWMDNQTVDNDNTERGQNTQIPGTVGTYKKVGKWVEDNLGKDTKILDASSGLGRGTIALREAGFDVDDIEPYPGKGRKVQPTYGGTDAYQRAMDDGKEYDYIISNAVLNVIPDDWRNGVLHDMASLLKVGGKMFINTRKAGEEKGIKNKIELESPQEVLVGTPDKITSYQRFFTPQELKEYVEKELGDGYTVEIAKEANSGTKGLAAVVVTKLAPAEPQHTESGQVRFSVPEEDDLGTVNKRFNEGKDDIRFRDVDEGQDVESEKLFAHAKKIFGVTNDLREAGYILPDGTLLDFSRRHMLNPGSDSSFLRGQRSVDHREIHMLNYESDGDTPSGMDTSMEDFIGRGAIRIDDNAGSINLSRKPTRKQAQVLRRLIQRNDGYVMVDIGNGYDSEHYGEYDEGTKASKVLGDIDRYFDEGIKFRENDGETSEDNRREVSRDEWRKLVDSRQKLERRLSEIEQEQESMEPGSEEMERSDNELSEVLAAHRDVMRELNSVRPKRTASEERQREAYARRQFDRARDLAREWRSKLHLDDTVEVYDSIDEVPDNEHFSKRKRRAKGWFDPKTGKIVIVIGNHRSPEDVLKTVLHEAVGHYGLRKLFGSHFDTFLDNVWNSADIDVQNRIREKMKSLVSKAGGSVTRSEQDWLRLATEEYLSELAESDEFFSAITGETENARYTYSWWHKIRTFFARMLRDLGLPGLSEKLLDKNTGLLTDNELRYVLWRSYKNLSEPGMYKSLFTEAEDVVMQEKLGVGEFEEGGGAATLSQQRVTPSQQRVTPSQQRGQAADVTGPRQNRDIRRTEGTDSGSGSATVVPIHHGIGDKEERNMTAYDKFDKPVPEYIKKWLNVTDDPGLSYEEKQGILEAIWKVKGKHPKAIAMIKTRAGYVIVNKDRKRIADALGMEQKPYMMIDKDDIYMVLPALVRHGHLIGIVDITDGNVREGESDVEYVGADVDAVNQNDRKNNFRNTFQIGNNFISLPTERDSEAIEGQRATMPPTATWRDGVEKVTVHTTLRNVKQKYGELHARAKAGDVDAAVELVSKVVKTEKVEALIKQHPNAKVAFVHAEEATGRNKLPGVYAALFELYGLSLSDVTQTNKPGHTGTDRVGRFLRRARFDGEVEEGREYILVDDHVTMGGTLRDLKDYIESKGGKVVVISTLTASAGGTNLRPTDEQLKELTEKGITNEQLKELGIADDINGLTKSEAREILVLANSRGNRGPSQGRKGDSETRSSLFSEDRDGPKDGIAGLEVGNQQDLFDETLITENGDKGGNRALFRKEEDELFRDDDEDVEGGDEELYDEGEQSPEAEAAVNVDAVDTSIDTSEMTPAELALQGMRKLVESNRENVGYRMSAMRLIGGNLTKLRQAMALQRDYDRQTVKDIIKLTKLMLNSGLYTNMDVKKVKRLLGIVQGVTGVNDVSRYAERLVDLCTEMQLNECKDILKKLSRSGKKVDAKGVEVQGTLDVDGQRMVADFKEGMKMEKDAIDTALAQAMNDMDDENAVVAKNAAIRYQALLLAKQYKEDVRDSEDQERELRRDIRDTKERMKAEVQALMDAGNKEEAERRRKAFKEQLEETRKAIREMRMERVDAYFRMITSLGEGVADSVRRAREFQEREKQRVNDIHHNANSDLEGIPYTSQGDPNMTTEAGKRKAKDKINLGLNDNNVVARIFFSTMLSMEHFFRFLGPKAHNGEGYLFNRFVRNWVDCNDREWRNYRRSSKELDAKVSEVFGRKMRWSQLFDLERRQEFPPITIEMTDNGQKVTMKLSQGKALYIYMVNKMSDGKMKLRNMGISEEDVAYIKESIDNRFIQLADWLQSEYLVKKREEYNVVHERMFGASMANIDEYFPIEIDRNSVPQNKDITDYMGDKTAATVTGAIMKRKKNSLPIDLSTDAFDEVLKHIQDMEHWAAWGEFNRDLNTLKNYTKFRNRLRNMSSLEFGSGEELLRNFDKVCAVANGVYGQNDQHGAIDKAAVNGAKGYTTACINLRFFTAMKQLLSLPAFANGDADAKELLKALAKNFAAGKGDWENTLKWAIENIPGLAKRWQSRQTGDPRLQETDSDFDWWHKKKVESFNRFGMLANASVDFFACALGGRAVYETKKKTYLKRGYTEEQAERRALQDASIAVNASQQSSEGAFVSPIQQDRTWLSVLMTVFRTASIGYSRRVMQGLRNIKYHMQKGYKDESIAFMAKQMVRDGLSEEQALTAAKHIYNRSVFRSLCDILTFGFVLPFFWYLGPYLVYLLCGDDDDEKKAMLQDSYTHALFGPIEGMLGGDYVSDTSNALIAGDKIRNHGLKEMPFLSKYQKMMEKIDTNLYAFGNDVVNLLIQGGFGVDPETFTNWFVAALDMFEDPAIQSEAGFFFLRFFNFPQSILDKLYLDELGMSAADARKLSADQLAARYARYKGMREGALSWWLYDDEARGKVLDKYEKRFEKDMKERMKLMDAEALEREYNWGVGNGDALRRKAIESSVDAEVKALSPDEVRPAYDKWKGAAEDNAYGQYWKKKTTSKYGKYIDENLENASDEKFEEMFNGEDSKEMRTKISNKYAKIQGLDESNIRNNPDYNTYYNEIKDYVDLAEDILLAKAKKDAADIGDTSQVKAIEKAQKHLTSWRKDLLWDDGSRVDADEARAVMEDVRRLRREYLRELGIMR